MVSDTCSYKADADLDKEDGDKDEGREEEAAGWA
jgi:hypothetical protein